MRAKHQNSQRAILKKKFRGLIAAIFFRRCTELWFCARQDRPHCRLVLKLNHGVDEQVGSIRFCLAQSRYGEFYTHS
jgi:hypothetical protein